MLHRSANPVCWRPEPPPSSFQLRPTLPPLRRGFLAGGEPQGGQVMRARSSSHNLTFFYFKLVIIVSLGHHFYGHGRSLNIPLLWAL